MKYFGGVFGSLLSIFGSRGGKNLHVTCTQFQPDSMCFMVEVQAPCSTKLEVALVVSPGLYATKAEDTSRRRRGVNSVAGKIEGQDEALQYRLALQTAKAIDTLHSSTSFVIHRDIKYANVLIYRNYNARLGDFGLALRGHVDDYRLRFTPPTGTMGYLDPCYVTPDNLSTKSDVFNFEILLLEIIRERKAIDITYSPPSIKGKLLAVYDPRIAPPKDPVVRKQLTVIAAKCVKSCRERRPSIKEVVTWLCELCKLVPLHSWSGFNNPCMMVEIVGRPVEARNGEFNSRLASVEEGNIEALDGRLSKSAMRYSRRVYSDLESESPNSGPKHHCRVEQREAKHYVPLHQFKPPLFGRILCLRTLNFEIRNKWEEIKTELRKVYAGDEALVLHRNSSEFEKAILDETHVEDQRGK
ncbi:hypothetical protein V8G54_018614 [Vigna mungo]|uniref:Protein kinase domain-containing protein n=1 Tax=Vigna mungo TaxID=3915 RepID=A0AAQ3RU48_VIGMU